MLNFKSFATKNDLKEASAIERRRNNEDQRKARIFNIKNRVMGVDTYVLEEQIKEKKRIAEEERKRVIAADEQRVRDDQLAIALERQLSEEKRNLQRDINSFRLYYQRPEDRREFDIYDPNGLKKDIPCRIRDDDPRCGASSAQKFEGEDLARPERLRLQIEQTKSWLQQQMRERARIEADHAAANNAHHKVMVARDVRACTLDRVEQDCRRRLRHATEEFNKALAEEQASRRRMDAMWDMEDSQADQYNHMTSDMLSENRDCAMSALGPNRIVPMYFRGMTDQQRAEIRQAQLRQIEEKKCQDDMEKRRNTEWDTLAANLAKCMELKEREIDRIQREQNRMLEKENLTLERDQKAARDYFDKVVSTNVPTCEFFSQFSTTSR